MRVIASLIGLSIVFCCLLSSAAAISQEEINSIVEQVMRDATKQQALERAKVERYGQLSLDLLLQLLAKSSGREAQLIAKAIISKSQVPPEEMIKTLKILAIHQDKYVRGKAAIAMSKFPSFATSLFKDLLALLADEMPNVRSGAAYSLSRLTIPNTFISLLLALKDDDSEVKMYSSKGLPFFGFPSVSAIPYLAKGYGTELSPSTWRGVLSEIGLQVWNISSAIGFWLPRFPIPDKETCFPFSSE